MNFQQIFSTSAGKILKIGGVFCIVFLLVFAVKATDPSTKMDFDGDGKTDIAVFRPGKRNVFPFPDSYFLALSSQTGQLIVHQWGRAYDIHSPADYDGDGKTDISVFRWLDNNLSSTESDYYVKNTSSENFVARFSGFGNIVSGNYFDDRKAEIALFDYYNVSEDPVTPCYIAAFFIRAAGTEFPVRKDIVDNCLPERQIMTPAMFDYNNNGSTDLCVFVQPPNASPNADSNAAERSSANHFNLWFSPISAQYTAPDVVLYFDIDYPIPGDYDGDGIGDFAGSKNVNGARLWRIRKSTTGEVFEIGFGSSADLPVPGDYDGDGKTDIAVFREGVWFIRRSTDGETITYSFGYPTDVPLTLPNSNVYY